MADDFLQATKDVLAKRVGLRCSKPDCRASTSGPHSDPEKVVSVGVAAHITAASVGGPRYNPALTTEQRRSAENGIWLCQTHAKLIDSDTIRFTVELLAQWKQQSEQSTQQDLEAMASSANRDVVATSGRLTAVLSEANEHFDGLSDTSATSLSPQAAEAARQLEHRISGLAIDALALKANPLFDAADRQETAIAVKTMKAALRLCGFQYRYAYVDYDEDVFRAYIEASQNEYTGLSPESARSAFVTAFDQFERLTGVRTLRSKGN